MKRLDLSAERLRELLHYDPETGVFTRCVARPGKSRAVGCRAGTLNKVGYRQIGIDGHVYLEHRLAFLYMTGEWPKFTVDHINCTLTENKWSNLRDVPQRINAHNERSARSTNSTGLLGVTKRADTGRHQALITVDGKHFSLGCFDTAEEAHEAYKVAKREMHEGSTL